MHFSFTSTNNNGSRKQLLSTLTMNVITVQQKYRAEITHNPTVASQQTDNCRDLHYCGLVWYQQQLGAITIVSPSVLSNTYFDNQFLVVLLLTKATDLRWESPVPILLESQQLKKKEITNVVAVPVGGRYVRQQLASVSQYRTVDTPALDNCQLLYFATACGNA